MSVDPGLRWAVCSNTRGIRREKEEDGEGVVGEDSIVNDLKELFSRAQEDVALVEAMLHEAAKLAAEWR